MIKWIRTSRLSIKNALSTEIAGEVAAALERERDRVAPRQPPHDRLPSWKDKYKATWKRKSKTHGARPVHWNHLDDQVDSDQEVVNKQLSL